MPARIRVHATPKTGWLGLVPSFAIMMCGEPAMVAAASAQARGTLGPRFYLRYLFVGQFFLIRRSHKQIPVDLIIASPSLPDIIGTQAHVTLNDYLKLPSPIRMPRDKILERPIVASVGRGQGKPEVHNGVRLSTMPLARFPNSHNSRTDAFPLAQPIRPVFHPGGRPRPTLFIRGL